MIIGRVDLGDLLARLEPVQQRVVALVYVDGRTPAEAARVLSVDVSVVAAALATAYRRIASCVLDGPDRPVPAFVRTASIPA